MEISARAAQLTASLTLSIDSKAKAMKAEGIDVCGFGAGEPDFDTPDHIKAAAIAALEAGFTKYTPSGGLPELRQAIAEKLEADNQLKYRPSQIIVSSGAKHSCYNAILATCQAGDEVLIPSPYWVSYPDMVRLAGAEPVIVPTTERNGWKMRASDFENAMTPRTKMLILNSPGNPTGSVYTREELEGIVEVAAEEDIYILSDEIYEKLVYDEAQHVSIASLSQEAYDLTITVNGFSKAYAMTGWRLGYMAAPEAVAKAADNIQSHSTSHPCSFAQRGALAALKGDQQPLADMRDEFGMRRTYMYRPDHKNPEHHRGETRRRVLHPGKYQPVGTQLAKLCRSPVEQGKCRGRSRDRLWRRSDGAPQLRDQHRRDQEGPGSLSGFLPDALRSC